MTRIENYVDANLLQSIFREQDAWLQLNRPWLTGILQHRSEPERYVRMASMVRQRYPMMPQVDLGNPAIEIGKDSIRTSDAKMAHFYAKQSTNEDDVRHLQKQIQMALNSNLKDADAFRLTNEYLGSIRGKILKMYSDNLTFFIGQLLTNPDGVSLNPGVHSEKFVHLQEGIKDITEQLSSFEEKPYSVLDGMIRAASKRGVRFSHILIGNEIAEKFINSQQVKDLKQLLATSIFNYKPINVDSEVTANGAWQLTTIGGVPVYVVSSYVTDSNGEDIDVFDPRAIVGVQVQGLGTIHTAPTMRYDASGKEILDPSAISFYELLGGEDSDKKKTYKSEGFYLITLNSPDRIYRLTLEGWS